MAMNIEVGSKQDHAASQFKKAEWKLADREHYGQGVDWESKENFYLKATEADQLLGILEMEIKLGVASIDTVIVAKDQRRRGIGRGLILRAEEIAQDKGSHKMFLYTGKTWEANELYAALGYKPTAEQSNHYLHHDFVEYSKFLS
jgi:ribosomal protein S18 acetylase RimI-like enzyme